MRRETCTIYVKRYPRAESNGSRTLLIYNFVDLKKNRLSAARSSLDVVLCSLDNKIRVAPRPSAPCLARANHSLQDALAKGECWLCLIAGCFQTWQLVSQVCFLQNYRRFLQTSSSNQQAGEVKCYSCDFFKRVMWERDTSQN